MTNKVCPVNRASHLTISLRKLIQDPEKMFRDYIEKGMTILDIGCGPGYFSIPLAKMVGEEGKVFCVDIQQGMLDKLHLNAEKNKVDKIITPHLSDENGLGITEPIDFAIAIWMVHEVPDKVKFFKELHSFLKKGAKLYISEPPFHVSNSDIKKMKQIAIEAGFTIFLEKKAWTSHYVIFEAN